MSKQVLLAGCSHSKSSGFTSENFNKYHYSKLLELELDINITNIARDGNSNFEITQSVAQYLSCRNYDFIIVQWSSLHRLWVYRDDHHLDAHDIIFLESIRSEPTAQHVQDLHTIMVAYFSSSFVAIKQWLTHIIMIQQLCKSYNTPCLFVNGFDNVINDMAQLPDTNSIDFPPGMDKVLYVTENPDWFINEKLKELQTLVSAVDEMSYVGNGRYNFRNAGIDKADDGQHWGQESNRLFADTIKEHILSRGIL